MSLNHPENTVRHDNGAAGAELVRHFHAATELESATYAARQARRRFQRGEAARLYWLDLHEDAKATHAANEVREDDSRLWTRVEFAGWALEDAKRNAADLLSDYREALARVQAAGKKAGEADSHEVPLGVRNRARRAILAADGFGNKVAMDATLYPSLKRPVLPELSPEVEVTEFAVIDPLEPVENFSAPESRAKLVPLEDYSSPEAGFPVQVEKSWETEEGVMVQGTLPDDVAEKVQDGRLNAVSIDPDDDGAEIPAGERLETEVERATFWREVNHVMEDDAAKTLAAIREDDEAEDDPEAVCPECRDGKCGNCDGTAWSFSRNDFANCAHAHDEDEAGR